MAMPTCYSIFFNDIPQNKILPSCRSLKVEYRRGTILAARFSVSWYRHSFRGYKLNSL